MRVVSDFRELNKRVVRKPFPIPKISTVLQELEGFTHATALDLNMGYYTIRWFAIFMVKYGQFPEMVSGFIRL